MFLRFVIRQILRRALNFAKKLNAKPGQFGLLVFSVIESLSDTFPELKNNPQGIINIINKEEKKFLKTLDRGKKLFNKSIENVNSNIFPAEIAWKLHDTHGFPIDLTQMLAEERGLTVNIKKFEELKLIASKRTQQASAHIFKKIKF